MTDSAKLINGRNLKQKVFHVFTELELSPTAENQRNKDNYNYPLDVSSSLSSSASSGSTIPPSKSI